jgi:hypothetical protein
LFKLMLAVHVFTHASLIREEDVAPSRWRERYSVKPLIEGYYALPPMANRAIKCVYSRIVSRTLQSVLERLQRILHGSSKMAKWMMAFCSVLVLGMCLEALQASIRMSYNDRHRSGEITKQDADLRADARCGEIDKSFLFIMTLFRHKFTNSFNFITGRNPEFLAEDAKVVEFVGKVGKLFDEKRKLPSLERRRTDDWQWNRISTSTSCASRRWRPATSTTAGWWRASCIRSSTGGLMIDHVLVVCFDILMFFPICTCICVSTSHEQNEQVSCILYLCTVACAAIPWRECVD